MKLLKIILAVLTGLITLIGALYAIDRHFAKEAKVQIIREDLDLTRQDNLIMQQRQDINRYEALAEFERRRTRDEDEDVKEAIIKREREKLTELKIEREQMMEKRK